MGEVFLVSKPENSPMLRMPLSKRTYFSSELWWLAIALWISIASLTSVTFLMDRLNQSFEKNANELMGADLLLRADQPLAPIFAQTATQYGLTTAKTTAFPTMVRFDQQAKLVALKAVTPSYPLRGKLVLKNQSTSLGAFEIWIDEPLANQLKVQLGDELELGNRTFKLVDIILKEPDRGAAFMNFSPRAMIRQDDLDATGLLGLGSRASYRLLLAGDQNLGFKSSQAQVSRFQEWTKDYIQQEQLRGVKIEELENGQPLAKKTIQQANKMMSLAALFTAMIAAVGIAISSHRYSAKHVLSVAVWRCFGASRQQILKSHLRPILLVGLGASVLGIAFGYVFHELLLYWLGSLIDPQMMPPSLWPIAWGFLVAATLLIGFSGPPLVQLTLISPVSALRQLDHVKSRWYFVSLATGLIAYGVLLTAIGNNIYLSLTVLASFVFGALGVMILAWLFSKWLGKSIQKLHLAPIGLKFMGQRMLGGTKFTVVQVTSLAIAMLALLLLTVIRTDVLSTWQSTITPESPNRFVLNISPDQKAELIDLLKREEVAANWDLYPMVRGRLIKINDQLVTSESFKDDSAKRLVDREFNLSYMQQLPEKNAIVAGKWLSASSDSQQVSMESGIMKSFGLKLGDQLSFDITGTVYNVRITSSRKLDWNSMRVNFFAIMPTSLLEQAPQSWIVAYRQAPNTRVDDLIVEKFPNISVINVEQTLTQINQMIGQLFYAVQSLFMFALLAGLIVLVITVFGVQAKRLREAAILKTYGADQRYLNRIWVYEFLLVGVIAGLLSGNIASLCAWFLAKKFLETEIVFPFWLTGLAVLIGITCSLISGLYLKYKISNVSTVKILQSY